MPSGGSLEGRIKALGNKLGFELVGISRVAPLRHGDSFADWLRKGYHGEMAYMKRTEGQRRHPEEMAPWAKSVISVGMNYYTGGTGTGTGIAGEGEPRGKISRYAWGEDYHHVVHERLMQFLDAIRAEADGQIRGKAYVDSGPVLEHDFAGRAGIGWIGKNTCLIDPKKGSWFFLGELFVDLELEPDKPMRDHCGACTLCLEACPTNAFVGPYVLDARRCISYLTIELKGPIPHELRRLMGTHIFGCDICQDVCPYNRKAKPTEEEAFHPRQGFDAPQLIPLLSLTEEEFRKRYAGSPITRAKRRGFLRNVCVALGNLRCEEAAPALGRVLRDDPEPLVRTHAAWALGQIGSPDAIAALRAAWSREADPEAVAEIAAALGPGGLSE